MGKVELMAPAGSFEALKAAVANGADAVYLGGKQFNARQGAENFTKDEITAAIEYAHVRGVRVYVAVNVLLSAKEIPEALKYMYYLGNAGVDGIIVQDLGLATLSRELMPELPLIGSTQMTVANASGAKYLQDLGFSRVVLARELSLEDIKDIRAKTAIELEVFIHGALCYAYSGLCLLSSMIGGRSGNRGSCAQPCRLAYTLVDAVGKPVEEEGIHLLSTRDLCTLEILPELMEAGINAFKIEGRMRRPEYVGVVTRTYRKAIDRFMAAPGEYRVRPEEVREAAQVFNRDFTTGYLERNPGSELMGYGRPSNRGIFLGRLGRRQGKYFQVKLEAPLNLGDGLEIWVTRGGHRGVVVHRMLVDGKEVDFAPAGKTVALEFSENVRTGDRIFKTSDARLNSEIRRTYTSTREEGRVSLRMVVKVRPGEVLKVEVDDYQGNRVEVRTREPAAAAVKWSLNEEILKEQLGRLGNTPYKLKELRAELEGRVMVPLSELNRLRREAVAALSKKRIEVWPNRAPGDLVLDGVIKNYTGTSPGRSYGGVPRLSVAVGSIEGVKAALAAGAERVYLAGEVWQGGGLVAVTDLKELFTAAAGMGAEIVPALPRVWHQKEAADVEEILCRYLEAGCRKVLVTGLGGLELIKRYGITGWGDYTLNVFNPWAAEALTATGIQGATASPELNREQIKEITGRVHLEMIVHGSLPLMISAHCVLGARMGRMGQNQECTAPCRRGKYGLKDRLGFVFPVGTDRQCRFYLYNPKEICLVDRLEDIAAIGLDWVRIEAREKGPDYVRKVTEIYRRALAALGTDWEEEILADAAKKGEELAPSGITRGHYFRGVG